MDNSGQMDGYRQLALRSEVISYLQGMVSTNQDIRLRLYIADEFVFMADDEFIRFLSEADEAVWYRKKGERNVYFAPEIYLEEDGKEKRIAMIRDVSEEQDYRKRNSVLRMDIGIGEIEKILRNATPTENAATYLVNTENVIVSVSDQEKLERLGLAEELPEEFRYSRFVWKSDLREAQLYQEPVYCMRNKIRNTDWEMITIIPISDMTGGIARQIGRAHV